jgi:hypothetical protein
MMSFCAKYDEVLIGLPLSTNQLKSVRNRYLKIVSDTEWECWRNKFLYNALAWVVTVGSIATTTAVAIGKSPYVDQNNSLFYYLGMLIPVAVALANKWLYFFNIQKKYIAASEALSKLHAEGWGFATAIGIYEPGSYTEKFTLFCARIENIQYRSKKIMINIRKTDGEESARQHEAGGAGEAASGEPATLDADDRARQPRRGKKQRKLRPDARLAAAAASNADNIV